MQTDTISLNKLKLLTIEKQEDNIQIEIPEKRSAVAAIVGLKLKMQQKGDFMGHDVTVGDDLNLHAYYNDGDDSRRLTITDRKNDIKYSLALTDDGNLLLLHATKPSSQERGAYFFNLNDQKAREVVGKGLMQIIERLELENFEYVPGVFNQ